MRGKPYSKEHGPYRQYLSRVLLLLILSLVTGCARLAYYGQSIHGQYELLAARRPITELLQDHTTPAALKQRLRTVTHILAFGLQELDLPGQGSYRDYADLKRRYVVWNIFATPAFSLVPRQSCFLIVGCLDYRGYFAREDATAFADRLRAKGLDVYMGGVAAYSTLGWFDDPVLNTMLYWNDARLAEVLLHELVHQKIYIPDDTAFNEALATSVAIHGVRLWLRESGRLQELAAYERQLQQRREFVRLALATRARLEGLYAMELPGQQKRQRKAAIFQDMHSRYRRWRHCQGDLVDYDAWMATGLNNAKLSAVATYHDYVSGFDAMLKSVHGDIEQFFHQVQALALRQPDERHAYLRKIAQPSRQSPCARIADQGPWPNTCHRLRRAGFCLQGAERSTAMY